MPVAAILLDRKNGNHPEELKNFFAITVQKVKQFTDQIYLLTDQKPFPAALDGVQTISFEFSNPFLDFITNQLKDKTVMLFDAYMPLLDVESLKDMLSQHQSNFFDFTYPENLPAGLLPEIIESGISGFIRQTLPENFPLFKNSVKELFERDISSYDSNIYISESRIVKYRLNFLPDNENDFLVLNDIVQNHGTDHTIMGLDRLIQANPEMVRKRPTYIEIELNTERESGEIFASRLLKRDGEMKPADFKAIIAQIKAFAHRPVVSLSLYGEPFLHSGIENILQTVRENPELEFIIESRSLSIPVKILEKALSLANVKVIFDLSASGPDAFKACKSPLNPIVPFEGLTAAEDKIKSLKQKEKIYPQFTRSSQNENELFSFYEHWKDYSDRIIIKKPDTFGGALNQYRVVDLSPVERFACLHLKHDMVVHFDGSVPLCRQDLNCENKIGSIITDGIAACWDKLSRPYLNQWAGKFNEPALCKGCDEWWVFNF